MGTAPSLPRSVAVGDRTVHPRRLLGEGGFSHVFLVVDEATGRELVLKHARVPADNDDGLAVARTEARVLAGVPPHPNLVGCLGQAETVVRPPEGGGTYVDFDTLLENCAGGTAAAEVAAFAARGEAVPEARVLRRWRDLAAAVGHLHAQAPAVVHRDIKLENLLLAPTSRHPAGAAGGVGGRGPDGAPLPAAAIAGVTDASGAWFVGKLCDFGSAATGGGTPVRNEAEVAAAEAALDRTTTLAFRAPELVDPRVLGMTVPDRAARLLGPPSDVWALGCALFALCYHGLTPFEDPATGVPSRLAILGGRYALPPPPPGAVATRAPRAAAVGRYSEGLLALIRACLAVDPAARPSVAQLLARGAALPAWPRDKPGEILPVAAPLAARALAAAGRPPAPPPPLPPAVPLAPQHQQQQQQQPPPLAPAQRPASLPAALPQFQGAGSAAASRAASSSSGALPLDAFSFAQAAAPAPSGGAQPQWLPTAPPPSPPLQPQSPPPSQSPPPQQQQQLPRVVAVRPYSPASPSEADGRHAAAAAAESVGADIGSVFGVASRRRPASVQLSSQAASTFSSSAASSAPSSSSTASASSSRRSGGPPLPSYAGVGKQALQPAAQQQQQQQLDRARPARSASGDVALLARERPTPAAAASHAPRSGSFGSGGGGGSGASGRMTDVERFLVDAFADTAAAPAGDDWSTPVDFGGGSGSRSSRSTAAPAPAPALAPRRPTPGGGAAAATVSDAGDVWSSGILGASAAVEGGNDGASSSGGNRPFVSGSASSGGRDADDDDGGDLRPNLGGSAAGAGGGGGRHHKGIASAVGGAVGGLLSALSGGGGGTGGSAAPSAGAGGGGGVLGTGRLREALHTRVLQVLGDNRYRWVIKATSLTPGPPKLKYVRRLVLDAWERGSGSGTSGGGGELAVVAFLPRRPLAAKPVVATKACALVLKLAQQGPQSVAGACEPLAGVFRAVQAGAAAAGGGGAPGSVRSRAYAEYLGAYAAVVVSRLALSSGRGAAAGALFGADRVTDVVSTVAAAADTAGGGRPPPLRLLAEGWAREGGVAGPALAAADAVAATDVLAGLATHLRAVLAAVDAAMAVDVFGQLAASAADDAAGDVGSSGGGANPDNLALMAQGGGGPGSHAPRKPSFASGAQQEPAAPPALACVAGSLQPLLVEGCAAYTAALFACALLAALPRQGQQQPSPSVAQVVAALARDAPRLRRAVAGYRGLSLAGGSRRQGVLVRQLAVLMDPVDALPPLPPPAVDAAAAAAGAASSSGSTLLGAVLTAYAPPAAAKPGADVTAVASREAGNPAAAAAKAGGAIPPSQLFRDPGPVADVAAGLRAIVATPGNEACAECGGRVGASGWASVNLGLVLCLRCSGLHRGLGVHVTQVRSLSLDTWKPAWVRRVLAVGNARANRYWEARAPAGLKPTPASSLEDIAAWVLAKYDAHAFAAAGSAPHELAEAAEGGNGGGGGGGGLPSPGSGSSGSNGDDAEDDESVLSSFEEEHEDGDDGAAVVAAAEPRTSPPPTASAAATAAAAEPPSHHDDWSQPVTFG